MVYSLWYIVYALPACRWSIVYAISRGAPSRGKAHINIRILSSEILVLRPKTRGILETRACRILMFVWSVGPYSQIMGSIGARLGRGTIGPIGAHGGLLGVFEFGGSSRLKVPHEVVSKENRACRV